MVQENCLNNFLIVICGPTGSGKSALAIELAKELNTEIISADSLAIYKQLDIGTAKPTVEERKQVKHHLVDVVEPTEEFSVSDFVYSAKPIVDRLLSENKVPIICGGTGFYINSILFDLSYGNCPKDDKIREYYENVLKEKGAEYLHSLLAEKDKQTAEKLHFNDTMRVIRALEIFDTTGIKKSDISDDKKPRYKYFAFCFDFDREVLYSRINDRVDKMFQLGLPAEVERLKNQGLTLENQSMQGIGYKEFFDFEFNSVGYESAKELIKMNSRRYAKRQITFFKKLPGIHYLQPLSPMDAKNKVLEIIKNELNN